MLECWNAGATCATSDWFALLWQMRDPLHFPELATVVCATWAAPSIECIMWLVKIVCIPAVRHCSHMLAPYELTEG
jgi:hypothetical protein